MVGNKVIKDLKVKDKGYNFIRLSSFSPHTLHTLSSCPSSCSRNMMFHAAILNHHSTAGTRRRISAKVLCNVIFAEPISRFSALSHSSEEFCLRAHNLGQDVGTDRWDRGQS